MKIQRLGKFDRYVVLDDGGRYWAGVCWASSLREARVFAERSKAEKVIQIIGQQLRDIENGHKYVAQVVVTTSSWLPLEELQETFQRHINIFNQIEDDLLVLEVDIDWDTLEKREDV